MSDEVQADESKHLSTHVAVCSIRYAGVNARLRRLEYVIYGAVTGLLGLQGWIIHLLLERSNLPFWPH